MPKVLLTEEAKRTDKLLKRMDRFDSVVNEYLRANHYTTSDLAFQLGIDTSSLWRYRKRPNSFAKAPFEVIAKTLRLTNCSAENVRYILGMQCTMKIEDYLSKHRFYELKHFCLQYHEWERMYFSRVGFPENCFSPPYDTTSKDGISRADLSYRMQLVEETCRETNRLYSKVLFEIVTTSTSAPRDPYIRELYYQFFKRLDKKRC